MNRQHLLALYQHRIDQDDRIKLSTQERSFLVQDFVQQLAGLFDPMAIEQLCHDEIALLERGYGKGTHSTINYLSKYRTAIAQATEQGKLPMTEETSYRFTGRKQRTGEPIESVNHIAYDLMRYDNSVYLANRKATNVGNNERQDNPQPFDPDRFLAKATELLASEEPETLAIAIVAVTGRRHTEVVVSGQFELTKHPFILTFDGQLKKESPVAYSIATLIPAKEVMQAIHRFRSLPQVQALAGLTSEDQTVKNFRARVNTRVKQHFQKTEILPLLPGFQSVSVHRLRGAYARMIIYFWLPNQGANEQRFLQFYLGHVEANQMKDAPNSGSTNHYFGYRLEKDGKPMTASGIKLMAFPPLPKPSDQQIQQQQLANQALDTPEFDEEYPMTPTPDTVETIAHQLEELPYKAEEMQQPQELQSPQQQPKRRASPTKPRFKDLAVNLSDLTAAAGKLGLELPKGKGQGYQTLLHQILQNLATADTEGDDKSASSTSQATGLNEMLAPLLQELSALREQLQDTQAERESVRLLGLEVKQLGDRLAQVEQERDHLKQQVEQLVPLQAECDRLKGQLQVAQDHLNQFRLIALGASAIEIDAAAQPVEINQPTTTTVAPAPPDPAPVPSSAASLVPTPAPEPKRDSSAASSGSKKLSPDDRITIAIEALIHHNQNCTDPKDRWFISNQTISEMTGTNNFTKVKPWMEQHPEMAERVHRHNEAMGTTNPHHNRGKDKEELRQIYKTFVQAKT